MHVTATRCAQIMWFLASFGCITSVSQGVLTPLPVVPSRHSSSATRLPYSTEILFQLWRKKSSNNTKRGGGRARAHTHFILKHISALFHYTDSGTTTMVQSVPAHTRAHTVRSAPVPSDIKYFASLWTFCLIESHTTYLGACVRMKLWHCSRDSNPRPRAIQFHCALLNAHRIHTAYPVSKFRNNVRELFRQPSYMNCHVETV